MSSARQNTGMREPPRPEFEHELVDSGVIGDVERPLGFGERLLNNETFQRFMILFVLIVVWEPMRAGSTIRCCFRASPKRCRRSCTTSATAC